MWAKPWPWQGRSSPGCGGQPLTSGEPGIFPRPELCLTSLPEFRYLKSTDAFPLSLPEEKITYSSHTGTKCRQDRERSWTGSAGSPGERGGGRPLYQAGNGERGVPLSPHGRGETPEPGLSGRKGACSSIGLNPWRRDLWGWGGEEQMPLL